MERGPGKTPHEQMQFMRSQGIPPADMIARAPHYSALRDDLPVNEYFISRVALAAIDNPR